MVGFQQKKSVRRVLQRFITDISRVVGARAKRMPMPPLHTPALFQSLLISGAWLSIVLVVGQWFVRFYCTVLFDRLYRERWQFDYYALVTVGVFQVLFHAMVSAGKGVRVRYEH